MSEGLIIAQFALQYGIPAARELLALLRTPNPTAEQWQKVWDTAEKGYDTYLDEARKRAAVTNGRVEPK